MQNVAKKISLLNINTFFVDCKHWVQLVKEHQSIFYPTPNQTVNEA